MLLTSTRWRNNAEAEEIRWQMIKSGALVFANGRDVLREKLTPEDLIYLEFFKTWHDQILRRFALLPTATVDGTVWLQYYWKHITVVSDKESWHWEIKVKAASLETLKAEMRDA